MHSSMLPIRVAFGAFGLVADQLRGRQRPFVVNHLVTVRCNLRCPFCYVSGPEQRPFNEARYPRSAELTTEETRDFYRQLVAAGFKLAVVLGGEPLLRTDLDEMLQVLEGHLLVNVFTNGFLLAQRAELLGRANTVFISLDAPDQQHDELRATPGSFDRALAGIDVLRTWYPHVRVALNMTVTRRNAGRVPAMLAFARELELPIGFQPPSYGGQFEVDGRPHLTSEAQAAEQADVAAAFRAVRDAARRGGRIIGTEAFFNLVIEDRPTYPCHYPRYAFGPVLPNGDVVACTTSRPLGNLREQSVETMMASPAFGENARDGLTCSQGCRDWGIHDLSAVFNRQFEVADGSRYFRTFVAPQHPRDTRMPGRGAPASPAIREGGSPGPA